MTDELAAPKGDEPKKKMMTAEEFVTKAPLYVKVPISFYPPREISFDCWDEKCGKETSWVRTDEAVVIGSGSERGVRPADYDLKSCSYICIKCQHSVLTVVYRDMQRGKTVVRPRLATGMSSRPLTPPASMDVVTQVMKVGQYPAPSVVLPKDLERNLGEDAAQFYRRALVCRNNGFGLAAATYIRRVVEYKTNELIELAAEMAESHQLDDATVAAIRKAADSTIYTRFEDKLQYASTVFPDSLLVGSYNPLATLYSLVSKAIHGLSEEECIAIADDTSAVFEYVFAKLALNAGIRDAELKSLTWAQVDLAKGYLTVGKSKTEAGEGRTIPFNTALSETLREYAEWYEAVFGEMRPEWYLFPSGKPRPSDPTRPVTTLKTAWNTVREKAKVKGRWHDHRHTLITDLAESGAGDQTIMDIAGHVSKNMLKHYSHIRMQAKREALESLVTQPQASKTAVQQQS